MLIRHKLKTIQKNLETKLSQDSRTSKAAVTGVTTLIARAISLSTGLVSIPITAQYLGKEQFGVWLLLSTFMNCVNLADLGLTNSLMNILATALGKGDGKTAKQSVSSAIFSMIFLGTFLIILTIALSFSVNWESILNLQLSSSAQQETRLAIAVSMCLFAVRLPLSIPRCIYMSYQEGYIYQLWMGLSNILSLLSLLIAQQYQANLPLLIASFFGSIMLGDLLAGIHIFHFRQPCLKPRFADYNIKTTKKLLSVGMQFWIAQISAISIFQSDLIIVSQLFGISAVADYGILQKFFFIIDAISSAFIMPLWPAYADAKARQDYKWIRKKLQDSIVITSIWSICAGSFISIFLELILEHWVGKSFSAKPELVIGMFCTYTLLSISQCMAIASNGIGEVKLQSILGPIAAITNIFLSIFLGNKMGVLGITLATSICIVAFSIIGTGGNLMFQLNKIDRILDNNHRS